MKMGFMFLVLAITSVFYVQSESSFAESDHQHKAAQDSHKLSLDGGAKWQMDSHTRGMFETMSQRIDTGGDPKQLGSKLKEDVHKLIQGCTMTGAAHEQLHVFLTPFIPAVTELSEQGSDASLEQVTHALRNYQNYFE